MIVVMGSCKLQGGAFDDRAYNIRSSHAFLCVCEDVVETGCDVVWWVMLEVYGP